MIRGLIRDSLETVFWSDWWLVHLDLSLSVVTEETDGFHEKGEKDGDEARDGDAWNKGGWVEMG